MALFSDDGTVTPDLAYWKFYDLVARAATQTGIHPSLPPPLLGILTSHATGRDFQLAAKLEPMLSHAGFTNITHIELKVPIGLWPADKKQKEIGAYLLLSVESGFEAFGMKLFTGVWDMTESEAKIFCAEVLRSAKDRKIHGYSLQWVSLFSFCFFFVCGKRLI